MDMQDGLLARLETRDGLRLVIHEPPGNQLASVPITPTPGGQDMWVYVVNDHVLLNELLGHVRCYDKMGKLMWDLDTPPEPNLVFGGPGLNHDRVLIAAQGEFWAINDDGSIAWKHSGNQSGFTFCTQPDAQRIYLMSGHSIEVLSVDGETLDRIDGFKGHITTGAMDKDGQLLFAEYLKAGGQSYSIRRLEVDGSTPELFTFPQGQVDPDEYLGVSWLRVTDQNELLVFTTMGIYIVNSAGDSRLLYDDDARESNFLPNSQLLVIDNTFSNRLSLLNSMFGCKRIELMDLDGKVQKRYYKKFWFTLNFAEDGDGNVYQLDRKGGVRRLER